MKIVKYTHTLVFIFVLLCVTTAPTVTIPLLYIIKMLSKNASRSIIIHIAKIWGRILILSTGSRINIDGRGNIPEGKALLIANHQSYFDIPVILGWICPQSYFLARNDLFKIPVFGFWLRMLEMIPVSRKAGRNELESFAKAEKLLTEGEKIVIFPEATRSVDGSIGEFRLSAIRPARKANAPIVPIIIEGTRRILPKNSKIISRSNVFVKILSPIEPKDLEGISPKELAVKLENKFREKLTELGTSAGHSNE